MAQLEFSVGITPASIRKAQNDINKVFFGQSSRLVEKVRKQQVGINKALAQGSSEAFQFGRNVQFAARRLLAWSAPAAVIFATINSLKNAVSEVVKLDTAARRLQFFANKGIIVRDTSTAVTKLGGEITKLGKSAGALNQTQIGFAKLRNSAERTSTGISLVTRTARSLGLSLDEVSDAIVTVARVGGSLVKAASDLKSNMAGANSEFVKSVVLLVRLEGGALKAEDAVRGLVAVQAQFFGETVDSARAASNFTDIAAKLAVTSTKTAADIKELSEATRRVGSAFKNVQNINLDQTLALLEVGFNTTGASVSRLSTGLRRMTTFAVKNAKEIKEISGLNIIDSSTGQVRGLTAILEVLQRIKDTAGTALSEELARALGGRNIEITLALAANIDKVKESLEGVDSISKRSIKNANALQAAREQEALVAAGLAADLNRLKAAVVGLVESEGVRGGLSVILKGVTSLIGGVDKAFSLVASNKALLVGIGLTITGVIVKGIFLFAQGLRDGVRTAKDATKELQNIIAKQGQIAANAQRIRASGGPAGGPVGALGGAGAAAGLVGRNVNANGTSVAVTAATRKAPIRPATLTASDIAGPKTSVSLKRPIGPLRPSPRFGPRGTDQIVSEIKKLPVTTGKQITNTLFPQGPKKSVSLFKPLAVKGRPQVPSRTFGGPRVGEGASDITRSIDKLPSDIGKENVRSWGRALGQQPNAPLTAGTGAPGPRLAAQAQEFPGLRIRGRGGRSVPASLRARQFESQFIQQGGTAGQLQTARRAGTPLGSADLPISKATISQGMKEGLVAYNRVEGNVSKLQNLRFAAQGAATTGGIPLAGRTAGFFGGGRFGGPIARSDAAGGRQSFARLRPAGTPTDIRTSSISRQLDAIRQQGRFGAQSPASRAFFSGARGVTGGTGNAPVSFSSLSARPGRIQQSAQRLATERLRQAGRIVDTNTALDPASRRAPRQAFPGDIGRGSIEAAAAKKEVAARKAGTTRTKRSIDALVKARQQNARALSADALGATASIRPSKARQKALLLSTRDIDKSRRFTKTNRARAAIRRAGKEGIRKTAGRVARSNFVSGGLRSSFGPSIGSLVGGAALTALSGPIEDAMSSAVSNGVGQGLGEAARGAGVGAQFGGLPGALAGALAGAIIGSITGIYNDIAAEAEKKGKQVTNIAQARRNLILSRNLVNVDPGKREELEASERSGTLSVPDKLLLGDIRQQENLAKESKGLKALEKSGTISTKQRSRLGEIREQEELIRLSRHLIQSYERANKLKEEGFTELAAGARAAADKDNKNLQDRISFIQKETDAKRAQAVLNAVEVSKGEQRIALIADIAQKEKEITAAKDRSVVKAELQIQKEKLLERLTKLGLKGSKEEEQLIIKRKAALNEAAKIRRKENDTIRETAALQNALLSSVSGRAAIELKLEFDEVEIANKLKALAANLKVIQATPTFTVGAKDSKDKDIAANEKEVADVLAKAAELRRTAQLNLVNESKRAALEQIDAWAAGSQRIVDAFSRIASLQANLAGTFANIGDQAQQQIEQAGAFASAALEESGASIGRRIGEARRLADARLAASGESTSRQLSTVTGGFSGVGDLTGQTDRLVNALIASGTTANEEIVAKQGNGINFQLAANRQLVADQRAAFEANVRDTNRGIEIRKGALQLEIQIIQQRLQSEIAFNKIRREQQASFGRLLLESPEQFKQTLSDIKLADSFFKGVKNVNKGGLQQISGRVRSVRRRGGDALLLRVLKGLQAKVQFGGDEAVNGVGNAQLQQVFESLQVTSVKNVDASIRKQAEFAANASRIQEAIKARQERIAQLTEFQAKIQEQQLRIAGADAQTAITQREQIRQELAKNRTEFSKDLLTLVRIQAAIAKNQKTSSPEVREIAKGALAKRTALVNQEEAAKKKQIELAKKLTESQGKLVEATKESISGISRFNKDIVGQGFVQSHTGGTGTRARGRGKYSEVSKGIVDEFRLFEGGKITNTDRIKGAVVRDGKTFLPGRNQARRLAEETLKGGGGLYGRNSKDRRESRELAFSQTNRKLQRLGRFGVKSTDSPAELRGKLEKYGLNQLAGQVNSEKDVIEVVAAIRDFQRSDDGEKSVSKAELKALTNLYEISFRTIIDQIKGAGTGGDTGGGDSSAKGRTGGTNASSVEAQQKFIAGLGVELDAAGQRFQVFSDVQINKLSGAITEALKFDSIKETLENVSSNFKHQIDRLETIRIKVDVPRTEHEVKVSVQNAITSEEFAQDLAESLSEFFIPREQADRMAQDISKVTAALVNTRLISASAPSPSRPRPTQGPQ